MNSYTQQQLHFYFSFFIYLQKYLMFIALGNIYSLQLHLSFDVGKKLVFR
jgi:hypothetical protein